MAEGEDPFALNDPILDANLEADDDEQELGTTRPFSPGASSTPYYVPGASSTPYYGGEYEMRNMMHEQSGMPYDEETSPLLGAQTEAQRSWDALTRLFPRASAINLETSYSRTGRLEVKMSGHGKKAYPLFTKDKQTGQERLNPQLTKEIKDSLGKSAEEIIGEDRDSIREQRQRLAEAEKQQRQAEK